ncbi:hypothetical protein GBAR_LOCUS27660, partial [Geodia barretti]
MSLFHTTDQLLSQHLVSRISKWHLRMWRVWSPILQCWRAISSAKSRLSPSAPSSSGGPRTQSKRDIVSRFKQILVVKRLFQQRPMMAEQG